VNGSDRAVCNRVEVCIMMVLSVHIPLHTSNLVVHPRESQASPSACALKGYMPSGRECVRRVSKRAELLFTLIKVHKRCLHVREATSLPWPANMYR